MVPQMLHSRLASKQNCKKCWRICLVCNSAVWLTYVSIYVCIYICYVYVYVYAYVYLYVYVYMWTHHHRLHKTSVGENLRSYRSDLTCMQVYQPTKNYTCPASTNVKSNESQSLWKCLGKIYSLMWVGRAPIFRRKFCHKNDIYFHNFCPNTIIASTTTKLRNRYLEKTSVKWGWIIVPFNLLLFTGIRCWVFSWSYTMYSYLSMIQPWHR